MRDGKINHIYYKIIGSGKPIIFISGLGADHQAWLPVINLLKNNRQCILFDNRGIGESSIPSDGKCTVEKMSEDVRMLLSHLGIEKVSMVGHSLGGYIAQVFAANYPLSLDRLILISTKLKSQPVQSLYQQATIMMMERNVEREIVIKNTLCWLFSNEYLCDPSVISDLVNFIQKKSLTESRKSYLYQVNATLNFDLTAYAEKISTSTLIIGGEQDLLVTVQDITRLNQVIKNSMLRLIRGMGHMAHIEIPEKVASFIR